MKKVTSTGDKAAVLLIAIDARTYLLARCFTSSTLAGGLLGSGHGVWLFCTSSCNTFALVQVVSENVTKEFLVVFL